MYLFHFFVYIFLQFIHNKCNRRKTIQSIHLSKSFFRMLSTLKRFKHMRIANNSKVWRFWNWFEPIFNCKNPLICLASEFTKGKWYIALFFVLFCQRYVFARVDVSIFIRPNHKLLHFFEFYSIIEWHVRVCMWNVVWSMPKKFGNHCTMCFWMCIWRYVAYNNRLVLSKQ